MSSEKRRLFLEPLNMQTIKQNMFRLIGFLLSACMFLPHVLWATQSGVQCLAPSSMFQGMVLERAAQRAIENCLTCAQYVRLMHAYRQQVNPEGKPFTIRSVPSGAAVFYTLMMTGFTKAIFQDIIPVRQERLQKELDKWKRIERWIPLRWFYHYFYWYKERPFWRYFAQSRITGHINSDNLEAFEGSIEFYVLQELQAMGVDPESVKVETDEGGLPCLKFSLPGESQRREIVFCPYDIFDYEKMPAHLQNLKVDAIVEKAAVNISTDKRYPRYQWWGLESLKENGLVISNMRTNLGDFIRPPFFVRSEFRTRSSRVIRELEDRIRKQDVRTGYGWEMLIQQRRDDLLPVQPEALWSKGLLPGLSLEFFMCRPIRPGQKILHMPGSNTDLLRAEAMMGARVLAWAPDQAIAADFMKDLEGSADKARLWAMEDAGGSVLFEEGDISTVAQEVQKGRLRPHSFDHITVLNPKLKEGSTDWDGAVESMLELLNEETSTILTSGAAFQEITRVLAARKVSHLGVDLDINVGSPSQALFLIALGKQPQNALTPLALSRYEESTGKPLKTLRLPSVAPLEGSEIPSIDASL